MEISVREAKAHFSAAIASAEKGEAVVVTRHGKPVATIIAYEPQPAGDLWERAAQIRKDLGIEQTQDPWPEWFDDAAFSRKVLGLED